MGSKVVGGSMESFISGDGGVCWTRVEKIISQNQFGQADNPGIGVGSENPANADQR